ncbi:Phosducin-like protein [Hypsizygus marmoreus]|uniref:Phosducin-like protein n=1 Tax=Hypsizygus marmoreus TaxID=39966 RepID=A0A369JII8_HYPMA|nr:Phosducin-like protein [Hypsizygus marmoreus]
MNADIEALVLSGELFNGSGRSSSPERSPSPDTGWHDDEISPEAKRRLEQGYDYDSDEERRDARKAQESQVESIGMGPGRTGVKGVIRDRNESEKLNREKREREMDVMQKRMEKSHLGGKTFLEEEREKGADEKVDEIILREREAAEDRRQDVFGRAREGRFGHLREVGVKGFLPAVENEDRGVWVIVHLYHSSLERCYLIDEILARLARLYPDTKFLRARASALGFACKAPAQRRQISRPSRVNRDDDEDEDDEDEHEEKEDYDDDDNVDLDMLPTMLLYRDGELVHNWVRVDWEAGEAGVEELLDRHRILPRTESILGANRNLGLPSDDEDDFDLLWSDDDDVDHT